jgi:hypothetical protein
MAGEPQKELKNQENCFENTDTVIRYEDVTIENSVSQINVSVLLSFFAVS